jgi:hypothetical protein
LEGKLAETTEAESQQKGSAKAQMMELLKVALTATVPAKALRKEPLKADWTSMTSGKKVMFLKAHWKSTAYVKAELMEAVN